MGASVKFHLKNAYRGGILRSDEVTILAKFTVSRDERFEVRTGHKIKPKYWDDIAQEVKRACPDQVRKNRGLSELHARLLDSYEENVIKGGVPFPQFKALSQGKEEKKSVVSLALDQFMAQYARERSPKSVRVYESFRKVFAPFQDRSFKQLNYRFFDEFKQSMEHLHDSTRHKYLACLQCFLNWCLKRDFKQVDLSFKQWRIRPRYREPLPLTPEELHRLTNKLMTGTAAIGRDYLCLACYTGARIGDIESFSRNNLNGAELTYNRKKGDSMKVKTITIDLVGYCSMALAILKKYNFELPKLSRPSIGKYIREAARLAEINTPVTIETKEGSKTVPKWQVVTSHTGRKTAITNMLQHFTTDEVMEMVGIDSYAVMKHYKGPLDRNLRRKRLVEMERQMKAVKGKHKREMRAV